MIFNHSTSSNWGHGLRQYRDEVGRFGDARIQVQENGPLRATIRVTSRYNSSVLRQDVSLSHYSADVQVRVQLDWREKHKMLKFAFPLNVEEQQAVFEIPYGFIERTTNGDEVPGQQWLDVSGVVPGGEGRVAGIALLNDAKYAYDVLGSEIRMTAVRSPIFADHYAERDDWVEYMDQGVQEFTYTLSPHSGGWKDVRIVQKAHELNVPPLLMWETYHKGTLPQYSEGIAISSDLSL